MIKIAGVDTIEYLVQKVDTMGKNLQEQISTLNSNFNTYTELAVGGSVSINVRDSYNRGNLSLLQIHNSKLENRALYFCISGNNNNSTTYPATVIPLLENTYISTNITGNVITVKNNASDKVYVHFTRLSGSFTDFSMN